MPLSSVRRSIERRGGDPRTMAEQRKQVYTNVTHRMCTHRVSVVIILGDARQHPDPVWPCDSSHTRSAGINQEEAAERCGLHRTYYSGIERGIRNVSLVNIEKVSKGLKVSLPDLFGRL